MHCDVDADALRPLGLVRVFPAPAYGRRLVGFTMGANRSGTIESVCSAIHQHLLPSMCSSVCKLLNVVGGEDEETKRRGGPCHSDAGSATGRTFGFTRQHCYVRRALPHAADRRRKHRRPMATDVHHWSCSMEARNTRTCHRLPSFSVKPCSVQTFRRSSCAASVRRHAFLISSRPF